MLKKLGQNTLSGYFSYSIILLLVAGISFFTFKHYQDSNTYMQKRIEVCKDKKDQRCYVDLVMNVFRKNGLDKALTLVTKIYAQDQSFSSSCHDLGHLLGSETYKLFKDGKPFKITPEAAFCSYGFYHGFMEVLASEGDVARARDFCKYVDAQVSKETPDASLQCYHGIGHGWVNIHGQTNLIGDDLGVAKKGLALCEKVAGNDSELSRCATGVFNGIAIFYGTGEYGLKVKTSDPLWLCRHVDKKFQDPCYISMNTVLHSLSGGSLSVAANFLTEIKDIKVAQHAMINLAIPFSLENIAMGSNEKNINSCKSLPTRLRIPCLQGLAFAFLEHGQPGQEYVKSIGFCKSSSLDENETKECLSYIYSYLAQWYPVDKANSICGLEGAYKDLCLENLKKGLMGLNTE